MIYPYKCPACNIRATRTCRLAEYEADPTFRCECGAQMERIITAPRLLANTKPFEAFRSPVDGTIITCERELREHNKRNNVVNIHEGYDEAAVNNFVNKDFNAELDKERQADLKDDMKEAVVKLEQGYKPQTAQESEIIPV